MPPPGVDRPLRRTAAELASPLVDALARYWDGKRDGRCFPARAEIDPLDIPALLPGLLLLDVLPPPNSYRVRLLGTRLAGANSRDLTGLPLERCGLGAAYEDFRGLFDSICASGQPGFLEAGFYWRRRHYRRFKMGVFPLGPSAEHVEMLLGGVELLPPTRPAP